MFKRLMLTTTVLLLVVLAPVVGQTIFEENFDYPAGDTLTNHNWTQIRNGTPITVAAPGLLYPGHPSSSVGNAVRIINNGNQEVSNTFPSVSSGNVYVSFLVNVTDASTLMNYSGSYFIYLTPADGSIFKRKLCVSVRKDKENHITFGVSKIGGINSTHSVFELNTTLFVVLKYAFDPDSADHVSLWVNPDLAAPEPPPDADTDTGNDAEELSEIVISQLYPYSGEASASPDLVLDGITITASWESLPTSVESAATSRPGKLRLSQNYPNPFNPGTLIRYELPKSSFVDLSVFDVLGRRVAVLASGLQAAGNYTVKWDANSFSAGLYYYRLNAGAQSLTKRMLLIK